MMNRVSNTQSNVNESGDPGEVSPAAPKPPVMNNNWFPGDIDLQRLMRVIKHGWKTVAAAVGIAFLVAILYLLVVGKTYRAISLLELSVRRPRIAGQQGAVFDDTYSYVQSDEILNTRLEKFKSRTLYDALIKKIRETTNEVSDLSDRKLMKKLQKRLHMALIRRSRLVEISFDDSDPEFAALVVNAAADVARKMAYEEGKVASDDAVSWLHTQVAIQRKALEDADDALIKFRASNKLDVLKGQRKTVEETLLNINKSLSEVESQLVLAQEVEKTLRNMKVSPETAGAVPLTVPRSAEIQAAMEKWLTAVSERDAVLTRYTEKHPDVIAKNKVINVLQGQVLDAVTRSRETAVATAELLKTQAAGLRKKMDEKRQEAVDLDFEIVKRDGELNALERAREVADVSYKMMLKRIEEARLSADENTTTVKLVERAVPPETPIAPRTFVVLFICSALGLVSGVGLAILKDILEDRIVSAVDLEEGLGIKILGVIPKVDEGDRKDVARICLSDTSSEVCEAFASLRTVLELSKYKESSRVLLVASTIPGEGKTVTACNLAIMSAKSGLKTVLIDFDLRRPQVNRVFPMPKGVGNFYQALHARDLSALSHLPYSSPCQNLDIIASRTESNIHPAEIVGGQFVGKFIQWVQDHYDRVIIDSPPFSAVSDAYVLADLVTSVLLVCRPGQSRKVATAHAIDRLRLSGANLLGVLVNDISASEGFYPGNSGYYYTHYNYSHYKSQNIPPADLDGSAVVSSTRDSV